MNIIRDIIAFRDARNWRKYHTPANVAAALVVEAAELLECFEWGTEPTTVEGRLAVAHELADVLIYALTMCHDLGHDPETIIRNKLHANATKYPIAPATEDLWSSTST